jgi:coenzyme F420-0:L-glutamate ligase / coenzyme F420-1:gamma-L-glutamate ligase
VTGHLEVLAPEGVPEVRPGDDLASLLLAVADLRDGDVVAVTSKVVAKAEGRLVRGERDEAVAGETVRVVARRGPTVIVRTRLGLTLAAAGVDSSNLDPGVLALHPEDPDGSARRLRAELRARTGANVAVLVTDTAGRAWRHGQTDLAIGAAGLVVVESYAGRTDAYGNPLSVTAPAVADELAGAAELAQGKLTARPFAVLRGRADLVLPPDDDGPGAVSTIREPLADMFGYGAREAVVRALTAVPADREGFGAPASPAEVVGALREVLGEGAVADAGVELLVTGEHRVVRALAFAHGWLATPGPDGRSTVLPPGDAD